jgi:hypothetical protein
MLYANVSGQKTLELLEKKEDGVYSKLKWASLMG